MQQETHESKKFFSLPHTYIYSESGKKTFLIAGLCFVSLFSPKSLIMRVKILDFFQTRGKIHSFHTLFTGF